MHLLVIFAHVIRSNRTKEANVLIGMELHHFIGSCLMWSLFKKNKNIQFSFYSNFFIQNLHKSPSSDRVHNWGEDCVSCEFCVASLDALVHSNSFQYHLKNKQKIFSNTVQRGPNTKFKNLIDLFPSHTYAQKHKRP